ncbi:hypothetical protein M569_06193, partial [Genlisea aurea]
SQVSGRALEDSIRISTGFPDMENTYASMKSLRYDVVVDVLPEVKWNPENGYKNLKIAVEIDREIDVQTAAEWELRRRLKSLGALRIVTDRGLEVGDVAVLDISAETIEDDESVARTIPSAESKGFQFDTEDDSNVLPGFIDSILGIQRGETKSFPYVFPDEWKQDLRGVRAQFTVECKELFYRDLPELNDSIADKILPGCATIEEASLLLFRHDEERTLPLLFFISFSGLCDPQVRETLLQKYVEVEETAREQATDNAILDQLQKLVEVDIPPSLLEEQGRELYGAQLLQIQANEKKLGEEQLASLSSPKAVNRFVESQRENITRIVKQNLAVGDIFRRENLQIPTEELVKEVEDSIAEFQRYRQEYDEKRVKSQVQEVLEGAKVLEWLRARADIRYTTK